QQRKGTVPAAPPAALAENLLRLANTLGDAHTFVNLLRKVASPENGRYAAWQFAALAGLLDALDQRNASLSKMEREGETELKAAVRQVAKLFDAARTTAVDTQAAHAERLEAVRVL